MTITGMSTTPTAATGVSRTGATHRLERLRVVAAYGGAIAMTPYLLIKVSWVAGALVGILPRSAGFSLAGWVALNTATIAMAATGIALALALVRPWGRRVPEAPLALLAWIGTGFLVPMLPYLVASALVGDAGQQAQQQASDPVLPGWEAVLITGSFAGLGLGLAIALPLHLLARHPAALRGHLGDAAPETGAGPQGQSESRSRSRTHSPTVTVAAVLSAAVGVLTAAWVLGATLGLAHPEARSANWYLLTGNTALWALAGAAALLSLTHRRPARVPTWLPVTVAWTSSGMLAAWSAWKLPLTAALAADPALADPWPEDLRVAAVQYAAGVVAGVAGLLALRATTAARK
jgi:hypothetical protein